MYGLIRHGDARVVIGTRSAVFAPVRNLGLIIIDEEQEHTYKSDSSPRYHARDVARFRAAFHRGLLLLASATPSLESFEKAKAGKYALLTLTERYGNARLPEVKIVDMREEIKEGNTSPLGRELLTALLQTFKRGEQSILFLNRRGYHNFIGCKSCGEVITCPQCSVSLTYHTDRRSFESGYLCCHLCGYRTALSKVCPSCGSSHLGHNGYGTQKIEEELTRLLPDARILRMDADSTGSKSAYENLLGRFRRREADILLGTQMVTKGHDFPDVTLVGVLSADSSLYLDDYRASERTFSLLTQVIGRAGRAEKPGCAVIQTNNPDSDVIGLACAQDYEAFFAREIRLRNLLAFPPYCDMVLLTVTHTEERELQATVVALRRRLDELTAGEFADVRTVLFGPFEAPIYRMEGKYRMRIVLKCRLNKRSRALLARLCTDFPLSCSKRAALAVDCNPSVL